MLVHTLVLELIGVVIWGDAQAVVVRAQGHAVLSEPVIAQRHPWPHLGLALGFGVP